MKQLCFWSSLNSTKSFLNARAFTQFLTICKLDSDQLDSSWWKPPIKRPVASLDAAARRMTHANMYVCPRVRQPRIHAPLGSVVTQEENVFFKGVACGKFGPISCPATSATKHMCVRSPQQWANQMGAKAEDMKPVIKSRVSYTWRCGEAWTEQYGRRLKRQ